MKHKKIIKFGLALAIGLNLLIFSAFSSVYASDAIIETGGCNGRGSYRRGSRR